MNLESLRSLQNRIREAKGADRKLDAEIAIALGLVSGAPWEIFTDRLGERTARNSMSGTEVLLRDFGRYLKLPKLTSDPDGLGSCVALMEELLPRKDGWRLSLHSHAYIDGFYQGDGICQATILHPVSSGGKPRFRCEGVGYCMAILLAIVAALIAQEEAKEPVKC